MCAPQRGFDEGHRVVRQQRQAKGKQRGLGIAQCIDLTRQGRGNLKKCGLSGPKGSARFINPNEQARVRALPMGNPGEVFPGAARRQGDSFEKGYGWCFLGRWQPLSLVALRARPRVDHSNPSPPKRMVGMLITPYSDIRRCDLRHHFRRVSKIRTLLSV